MKQLLVASVILALGFCSSPSKACERVLIRAGLPDAGTLRAVGKVIGYATVEQPFAIDHAPSLVVRIDTVVSGKIPVGEAQVVPLRDSPACTPWPESQKDIEQRYPIGSTVVFFTYYPVTPSSPPRVLAHNSIFSVPVGVTRTADGDLDFEHASPHWDFVEFEFARAVIALRRAEPSQKFRRLMNLAHYDGFREPQGRTWLQQLISESRLSSSQRNDVLKIVRPY
jgi:hypothetical protein